MPAHNGPGGARYRPGSMLTGGAFGNGLAISGVGVCGVFTPLESVG